MQKMILFFISKAHPLLEQILFTWKYNHLSLALITYFLISKLPHSSPLFQDQKLKVSPKIIEFYVIPLQEIINFIINTLDMFRKAGSRNPLYQQFVDSPKDTSHSLSTEGSPRQHALPPHLAHKQKSQLCKKFIQHGYCPYEKKCKFAHGLHQLKKNQQTNSKYKTKTCGGFMQEGFCPYGNRCNFIHPQVEPSRPRPRQVDVSFLCVTGQNQQSSRLLQLLKL